MTQEESTKLFDKIKSEVLQPENIYDHWYQQDNDLLIFDNSVTVHRRLGSTLNRIAYRAPFDLNDPVKPRYNQSEFQSMYDNVLKMFSR